jgi:phosphosulfolactate synthase
MTDPAFSFVLAPMARSPQKPRRKGLTSLLDYGLGLARQRDLLELAGHVIDIAKVATATARVYDESVLRNKLATYRQFGVRPYLGGQFAEYVYATSGFVGVKRLFEEAYRVGFDIVEVSDTCAPLSLDVRRRLVETGRDAGLAVASEVGQLVSTGDHDRLIDDAKQSLQMGAEYVVVEGSELVERGGPRKDLIRRIHADLPIDRLLLELPGPGIGDATVGDIERMKQMLVREFGPDVNLANIPADEIVETEVVRLGIEDPTGWVAKKERE